MVQIRLDGVTKSRAANGADANGQPTFTFTYTVQYTILSDPPLYRSLGYHRSKFSGMTRDQIRTMILSDIKAILTPQADPNDASAEASITPGESVNV